MNKQRPAIPAKVSTLHTFMQEHSEYEATRDNVFASVFGNGYHCEISESSGLILGESDPLKSVYKLHLYSYFDAIPSMHIKLRGDSVVRVHSSGSITRTDPLYGIDRVEIFNTNGFAVGLEPVITLLCVPESMKVLNNGDICKAMRNGIEVFSSDSRLFVNKEGELMSTTMGEDKAIPFSIYLPKSSSDVGLYTRINVGTCHRAGEYTAVTTERANIHEHLGE